MRFFCALMVAALLTSFIGTGTATAVGYDSYEVTNGVTTKSTAHSAPATDLGKALREASFVDQYPKVIDDVVFFVKDILGQFGITKPKADPK